MTTTPSTAATFLTQADNGWWDHMSGWGSGWMWFWGILIVLTWVAIGASVWLISLPRRTPPPGAGHPPTHAAREKVAVAMAPTILSPAQRSEMALELLEDVPRGARPEHRPSQLSAGERQRVAIARARANSPDVFLAEEPTGNLDTNTGDAILSLLYKLWKEPASTVVLITHDDRAIAEAMTGGVDVADGRIGGVDVTDGRIATDQGEHGASTATAIAPAAGPGRRAATLWGGTASPAHSDYRGVDDAMRDCIEAPRPSPRRPRRPIGAGPAASRPGPARRACRLTPATTSRR
jgi:energy-coupling factor transporter ATP-binding protein EcfA2